jgi:hypothetical protein
MAHAYIVRANPGWKIARREDGGTSYRHRYREVLRRRL